MWLPTREIGLRKLLVLQERCIRTLNDPATWRGKSLLRERRNVPRVPCNFWLHQGLGEVIGCNLHDEHVEVGTILSLVILRGRNVRQSRAIAQQPLGILSLARWRWLLEACEQLLTDIHTHRLTVVCHKE